MTSGQGSCGRACAQDVDAPFGSAGSFFLRAPTLYGSYEANPPFVPVVMDAAAERFEALLAAAEAGNQARPKNLSDATFMTCCAREELSVAMTVEADAAALFDKGDGVGGH